MLFPIRRSFIEISSCAALLISNIIQSHSYEILYEMLYQYWVRIRTLSGLRYSRRRSKAMSEERVVRESALQDRQSQLMTGIGSETSPFGRVSARNSGENMCSENLGTRISKQIISARGRESIRANVGKSSIVSTIIGVLLELDCLS
jgi:hypothetical protein